MDGNQAPEGSGLHVAGAVIPFKRLGWGIGVAAAIVIASVVLSNNGIVNGFIAGGIAVAGGVVGLLFQPQPKPEDYSTLAATSVERMYDMGTNLTRAQETISALAAEATDPIVTLRLISTQDILLAQQERLQRTVSDWNEVSPGVAEQVRQVLDRGKRRFEELTRGETHVD